MKYPLLLVLLVAIAIVGYRVYVRRSRLPQAAALPEDPNVFMPEFADRAVRYATERGTTLDYSPQSVKSVESLLAELHESRTRGELDDGQVNVHAMRFGAYIGEVLRRQYGGSWAIDHSVAGPKSFPIHWKGHDSFPVGWCGKRILNGDEDNVWFKYQVVTSPELGQQQTRPLGT